MNMHLSSIFSKGSVDPLKQPVHNPFPSYMQISSFVPTWLWGLLRISTLIATLGVVIILFIKPTFGLLLFWGIWVPLLPALWFTAPGLWRNICPLAALNQIPRHLGISRAKTWPQTFQPYIYVVAMTLFFITVIGRKFLFNTSGLATGLLILGGLAAAIIGGFIFKGKSGWCGSVCPLSPIQRVYGQTPFVLVGNNYCKPCISCTKNCYDLNPNLAYLADINDSDPGHAAYRKFFIASFPGLIVAFNTIPDWSADDSPFILLLIFVSLMLISIGLFYFLAAIIRISLNKLVTLYGAAAINLYYAYCLQDLVGRIFTHANHNTVFLIAVSLQGLLAVLSLLWIYRTWKKEALFFNKLKKQAPAEVRISVADILSHKQKAARNLAEVHFVEANKCGVAKKNDSILDVAERCGIKIEAGCRMGMCGADPVCIEHGMNSLSPLSDEERATIERLGLSCDSTRMACSARVYGQVKVSFELQHAKAPVLNVHADPSIKSVVVIGNGIAGITAAERIRRLHPDTAIHVISREPHHLYNRMGISLLIYGQSAMIGLYLQRDSWYDEQQFQIWLNTLVTKIDREAQEVHLGTLDKIAYDRLIIAMGSNSFIPPISGFGMPGTFGLRSAEEAMAIRAYAQTHDSSSAVVIGGGLLGLEAGYALRKIVSKVTILESSKWLLPLQLDRGGAQILCKYFEDLGIHILTSTQAAAIKGSMGVEEILLQDGRSVMAQIALVCAGIEPNVQLAKNCGLKVQRGIVVDDNLRTSDPLIYAVGDVAEHQGRIYGLWPAAVEQATCAAANAVGQDTLYEGTIKATILKVSGIELVVIGQFERKNTQEEAIIIEEVLERRYRKLVIAEGCVVGGILINNSELAHLLSAAIKRKINVSSHLAALRTGDWQTVLTSLTS